MLSNTEGWLLAVGSISIVWITLLIRTGPGLALGAATVLSFAFPTWIRLDVLGLPLDVRTAVLCITLSGYSLHPRGKIISPITMLDICVELIFVAQITADSFATGFRWTVPCVAYGEWFLPYLAGRFAIQDRRDLRTIAPWVAGVLIVLGGAACFECVTHVNPFEVVFGNRPEGLFKRTHERFGLKRAFGTTMHPIYLGMLLLVLMPWLISLWQSGQSLRIRKLTILAGMLAVAATIATVSRTPVITLLLCLTLLSAVQYRVLRWPLALTAATAFIGFLLFTNEVTDTVSRWSGGGDRGRLVEVDGQAVVTSDSRSRLVLFAVYSDALVKGGLTGYGSKAVEFPPTIPYLQGKSSASDVVDNAWVLITLRFGWLGGGCFLLLMLTAIFSAISIHLDHPDHKFAAVVASLFIVMATFSFFLVWMSYDFGLPILWTFGILSGLRSSRIRKHRSAGIVRR